MFTKKDTDPELSAEITRLYKQLSHFSGEDKEYAEIVKQLSNLYSLKEKDSKSQVSMDTLVMVAGNLLGIILVLDYERMHVVSSKALGFVMKLR